MNEEQRDQMWAEVARRTAARREWVAWFVAALRTPSRVFLLLVAAQAFVVLALDGDRPLRGLTAGSQVVGGLAVLFIIGAWRAFWTGPAVLRTRARRMGLKGR